MKQTIFILILFLMGLQLFSQETNKATKSKKELRKEAEKETMLKTNELIRGKNWVLEADRLYGKKGQVFNLTPTINFVSVKEEDGIIQLSFESLVGWNGLGGITLEGKVRNYKVKEPKKEGRGVYLTASFSSPGSGFIDMQMMVSAYNSEVTLSGNWGERIRFQGKLVHPSESSVFKGIPRY